MGYGQVERLRTNFGERGMNWAEIIGLGICAILIVLPPKYDPAIRFKEWIEKKEPKP